MRSAGICTLLIASVVVLGAVPALAAPRDDALAGISRCAGLGDDRALLECIYGAAQPLRAELGLAPASPAQVKLVPPISGAAPQAMAPMAAAVARVNAPVHMTAYKFDTNGLFLVSLSNGESWQQVAKNGLHARWREPAANYVVEVDKNWAGSYILKVHGDGNGYFVEPMH